MPYWAEGFCPVCKCSFAYKDVNDESDKCSSVSTSVSQRARLISQSRQPGQPAPSSHLGDNGGFGSFGGSLGPKVLQILEGQKSTSCGARSDASDLGDGLLRSPRSGISGSLSRTSSG